MKSRDRQFRSVEGLQNCRVLRAIGEMLTRHNKGRANPVAWKQDELRFGIGVGFYCFWSRNIKLSFSKVLLFDLCHFSLKPICSLLFMSLGAELNQFCKSQPY